MSSLKGTRILIVEDVRDVRLPIARYFESCGAEVVAADSVASALETLGDTRPDVALIDYGLPDGHGIDLIRAMRELDATIPSIVLTGHGTIDLAVAAIKEGAEQFLTKPVELATLALVIERVLGHQRDRAVSEAARARRIRASRNPFLGKSPRMCAIAETAERVAATAALPVLISGETGSGKGVLAEWLHRASPRSSAPFVEINCAGLSPELLESELFGYEKGAFTGAVGAKPGLLEVANRGTLFLDEIGDMDLTIQAKLLKVVEDMRFRRLGEVRDRRVDVWLIAATHHDLPALVAEGRFRQDLLYRLNTVQINLPPLREHPEDIPAVADSILEDMGRRLGRRGLAVTPEAQTALRTHTWRGNLRELRNALERAALFSSGPLIEATDLTLVSSRQGAPGEPATGAGKPMTLAQLERCHIEETLRREGGNISGAARALGISRSALYEKIRRHGLPGADRSD